jgi:hypothetical protein
MNWPEWGYAGRLGWEVELLMACPANYRDADMAP